MNRDDAEATDGVDELVVIPVTGMGEISAGDDLAALLAGAAELRGLANGDVLVVTSKVVSKAEGSVRPGSREEALAGETVRVVARRGRTTIARTHHGLVLAAAGVDASNVPAGEVVLLPRDPDASARGLRERLLDLTGRNVGVVVTDTAGRSWRTGQTDIAIGAAGIVPQLDYAGRLDRHGNQLQVTSPAVADEVAAAADLVTGKVAGRPAALVRGLAGLVLPAGEHGPGGAALVRPEGEDLFGYGARQAVLHALAADPALVAGFGAPVAAVELVDALVAVGATGVRIEADTDEDVVEAGGDAVALTATAYAHGWLRTTSTGSGLLRFTAARSVST
jgi:coenzyme F420-0:L-glutamate ligase/coenzyme F420-1:gamma-L-glutamate ligase